MTNKCECTLAISLCGDGCRYCQPQEYIDRLHEQCEEIDKENEVMMEALEEIVNDAVNYEGEHYVLYFASIGEKAKNALDG